MHRHSCSCIDIIVITTAMIIFTGLIFSADEATHSAARDYAAAATRVWSDTPMYSNTRADVHADTRTYADTHAFNSIVAADLTIYTVCRDCTGNEYRIRAGMYCDCPTGHQLHLLLRPTESISDVDKMLWPRGDRRRLNISAILATDYIQLHGLVGYGSFVRANGAYITE